MTLNDYIQQSAKEEVLTSELEQELAQHIATTQCPKAINRLAKANLRLVVKYAFIYLNPGISLDDLIGEGNVALLEACREFQPRGFRFATFATWKIRSAMQSALYKFSKGPVSSKYADQTLKKIRKAEEDLTTRLGREPTEDELAEACQMTQSRIQRLKQSTPKQYELSQEDSFHSIENIPSENIPQYTLDQVYNCSQLMDAIEQLTPREQTVIKSHFGIDRESNTLQEIGDTMNVSREYIRQIEKAALQKLRNRLQRLEVTQEY